MDDKSYDQMASIRKTSFESIYNNQGILLEILGKV